jgi:peptidoglycan/LPS O-acetylase OafA/YrhL
MYRAIAAALLAIAVAAFALARGSVLGTFFEPALLAGLGSFFLVAARMATPHVEDVGRAELKVLREIQGR